jgi:hypothetical protein
VTCPSTAKHLCWLHQPQDLSAQSLIGTDRGRVCVCAFVGVSAYACLWAYALYRVLKNKPPCFIPFLNQTPGVEPFHYVPLRDLNWTHPKIMCFHQCKFQSYIIEGWHVFLVLLQTQTIWWISNCNHAIAKQPSTLFVVVSGPNWKPPAWNMHVMCWAKLIMLHALVHVVPGFCGKHVLRTDDVLVLYNHDYFCEFMT